METPELAYNADGFSGVVVGQRLFTDDEVSTRIRTLESQLATATARLEAVERREAGLRDAAKEFYNATVGSGPESPGMTRETAVVMGSRSRESTKRVNRAADVLEAALLAAAPAAGEPLCRDHHCPSCRAMHHDRFHDEGHPPCPNCGKSSDIQPAALPEEALLTAVGEAIEVNDCPRCLPKVNGDVVPQPLCDDHQAALVRLEDTYVKARKAWEASRQLSGDLGRDMALLAGYEAGRADAEAEARERAGEGEA